MRSLTVTLLYCMPYGIAELVGENDGTGVGIVVGTGVGVGDLSSKNNPAKEREQ